MAPFPLLCTGWRDRELLFTYATVADIEDYVPMLAKPGVTEHVFYGPNTPEQTRGYFTPLVESMATAVARRERPDSHIFTVRHTSGALVGECALLPVMFSAAHFEIGYQLDEPWWGRGYGTRMAEMVLWYGFSTLGAHRLSADTLDTNAGSIRILDKLGFRREGVRTDFYTKAGRPRAQVLFGLLRADLQRDLDAIGARLEQLPA